MADAGPDDLMSAPPGSPQDAGSDNTIAATVEAAKAAGMAHVMEIEQATHTAGEPLGDLLPMPDQVVDHDTSILGGQPPSSAAGPQGSGIGDNG